MQNKTTALGEPSWCRVTNTVLGLSVAIYVIVFIAYFWAFAKEGCCDQATWGQFGDFVGGVAGPLLGAVSVFLLVTTLHEQRRMLDETKKHMVQEELQRVMFSIADKLDTALSRKVEEESRLFQLWAGDGRLWKALSGRNEAPTVEEAMRSAYYSFRVKRISVEDLNAFARAWELQTVRRHLLSLDGCLIEYFDRGGDTVIGTVYGNQYRRVATLLAITDQFIVYRPGETVLGFDALRRMNLSMELDEVRSSIEKYFPDRPSL